MVNLLPDNVRYILSNLDKYGFSRQDLLSNIRFKHVNQRCFFCPITAVCYALTKHIYRTQYYEWAANKVNLPWQTASAIQAAADDDTDVNRRWLEELIGGNCIT